jgi:hypothetical protein
MCFCDRILFARREANKSIFLLKGGDDRFTEFSKNWRPDLLKQKNENGNIFFVFDYKVGQAASLRGYWSLV